MAVRILKIIIIIEPPVLYFNSIIFSLLIAYLHPDPFLYYIINSNTYYSLLFFIFEGFWGFGVLGFWGAEGIREQKVLEGGLGEREVLDEQEQGDPRAGWNGCPGFGS